MWFYIFEEVVRSSEPSFSVQTILLVCKAWKACATPLLYRYIRLLKLDSVRSLLVHLVSQEVEEEDPRRWIHSIYIGERAGGMYNDGSRHDALVSSLLSQCPDLRSFSSPVHLNFNEFDSLLRASKDSLLSLDVVVGSQSSLGALSLGLIGRFKALRDLSIWAEFTAVVEAFTIDTIPAFDMPSLYRLRWASRYQHGSQSPFLALLSRSRFPNLAILSLDFPSIQLADIQALEPFFQSHGSLILKLDVNLPPQLFRAVLNFLNPSAFQIRDLDFPSTVPPITIVEVLPPSVKILHIVTYSARGDWEAAVALFDAIANATLSMPVKAIYLTIIDWPSFTWRDICQAAVKADVAMVLLGRALKLAQRGVVLLDSESKGLQLVDVDTDEF